MLYQKKDQGFTLVELSIVLIIIGLLVGGILKGQELISNARIASTLQQIKSLAAGIQGFQDAYNYLPGDLPTPTLRLPDCPTTTICGSSSAQGTTAGSTALGDGAIGLVGVTNLGNAIPVGLGNNGPDTERAAAFVQLTASDFIGGMDPNSTENVVFGAANPASTIVGGGYRIGLTVDGTAQNLTQGANSDLRRGHYLEMANDPSAVIDNDATYLTGTEAARMDRKVDDGFPNLGLMRAAGPQGNGDDTDCAAGTADADIYAEANTQGVCSLYVRVTG